jgi:tripartite ATP-independent transporter DctM subunit
VNPLVVRLWFRRAESLAVVVFIGLLALLPLAEMVARTFFRTGIPAEVGLMAQILIVLGFLSATIAARQGDHLNIALIHYWRPGSARSAVGLASSTVATTLVTIFFWSSLSFVQLSFNPWTIIGFIPDQVVAWVMPIGYALIAWRLAVYRPEGRDSWVPFAGLLAGTVLALPVIARIFWGTDVPPFLTLPVASIDGFYSAFAPWAVLVIVLSAFAGTPLFVVIGSVALFFIKQSGGEFEIVANQAYTELTQTTLPAIPLFTIAGFLLSESQAGARLIHVFRNLFGWLPGGMIIATVVVCAFFTTFTGASGVTIIALGGLLSKILVDHAKIPRAFALGLITAVGSIGILFPPSLPIILVGATTQTSILQMFAGGILPGVLMVLAMVGYGVIYSIRHKVPVEPFSLHKTASAAKASIWEILLPVILVTGYFTGLLSIVETSAVAVLYTVVIEVFVNRDISLKQLPRVILKGVPIIGGVLALLASSQALSYFIVDSAVPQALTRWVQAYVTSPYLFILILNVALLVAGSLMDIFSAILILLPLIAPLGAAYGINPVHLGIIFLVNMEVGFLLPPIGLNLFLASYRFQRPYLEISRNVFPFLVIQIAVVLIVSYVPFFTTALASFF